MAAQMSAARKLAILLDVGLDDDQLNLAIVATLALGTLLVLWLVNAAVTGAIRFALYTTAALLAVALAGRIVYGDWELLRDMFGCDCTQCLSGGGAGGASRGWAFGRLAWGIRQLAGLASPSWMTTWLW